MTTGWGSRLAMAMGSALLITSCGGTAVIDAEDGTGGTGTGTGTGSPLCATPDPVGELTPCGGSYTPSQCSSVVCDEAGHTWESSCDPGGCICLYDGQTRCTCSSSGVGHPCDGVTASCCPAPFPP